ncbi:hypothetical protein [Marivita hallyeonensis]|uniref:hypothetical protein n=1 Tax=Marivita hallyeonensis TaxID=996342 RepID=UPI000933F9E3|nr:hypothetical protein [Marivita hallyeonensis]
MRFIVFTFPARKPIWINLVFSVPDDLLPPALGDELHQAACVPRKIRKFEHIIVRELQGTFSRFATSRVPYNLADFGHLGGVA